MKTSMFSYLQISKNNLWKSLAILLVGFALTVAATYFSYQEEKEEKGKEFHAICSEIKSVINARLYSHALLLRSGAALFVASDTVNRHDWKEFFDRSKASKNLPGLQGVGYAMIIPKNQLQQHNESIKEEGFPNYKVFPEGDRDVYTSVLYLEPFEDLNLRALGYDMWSEPFRRKAMQDACDSDWAVLSGKVKLVQEAETNVQPGTLMYVPVYRNAMPINTVAQRRAAIKGWVYSPFRMKNLMKGTLSQWDSVEEYKIRLQVYDDDITSAKTLLFDNQKGDTSIDIPPPSRSAVMHVDFNGKHWLLSFSQQDTIALYLQGESLIVFVCGCIMSVLLFSLSFSLFSTHFRAQKIADKLTSELKESEQKFSTAFHSSPQAVTITGLEDGLILEVNESYERMLGFSKEEAIGHTTLELGVWITPEQRKCVVEMLHKEGRVTNIELDLRSKNGTILNMLASVELIDFAGKRCMLSTFFDITERKKAEGLYHLIADHINDFVWLMDMDLKATYVSPSIEKKSGFTGKELKEMSLDKTITPESLERALVMFQSEMPKFYAQTDYSSTYILALEFYSKDGSTYWCECKFSVIRNESGVPVSIIGEGRDITERKMAEEKLIEKEASLRFAQQIAKMGSWDFDMQTQKTNWSENYYTFFGFDPSEVEPSFEVFQNAVYPDDLSYFNDMVASVYAEKKQISFELRIIAKDNKVKWVFNDVVPVSQDGELVKIYGAFIDITERKQWEDALRDSEEKFKYMFENSVNGNSITQLTGEITFNKSASEVLGYSQEELQNFTWADIMHPDDLEIFNNEISLLLSGEKEWIRFEKRFINKSGSILWADMSSMLRKDENGKPLYFMSSFINNTKRKQAEEKLIEKEASLRFAQQIAKMGSWDLELQTQHIKWSENVFDFYGFDPSKVEPSLELFKSTIFPEDIDYFTEMFAKIITDKTPVSFEMRVTVKNNAIRWIQNDVVPIIIDGVLTRMTGAFIDITERKQAEDALIEKQNQFYNLANSSLALIWQSGADKLCYYFNSTWLNFTGRTLNQEMGNGWAEGVHPEDFDRCLETYVTAFDRRETFEMEYRLRHANGEYRWLLDMGTPNYDKNNNFVGYIGHCFDITERKLAEELLQESKDHFHAIFQNNAAAITIIEADSTISMVNDAYCQLSGYTREETIGVSWTAKIPEPDLSRLKEYTRLRLTEPDNVPDKYEFKFYHKNGQIKHVLASVAMIEKDKKIIVSFVDIHNRKLAEDKLLFIQKAIDSAPVAIGISDAQGHHFYQNKASSDMFEYATAEEFAAAGGGPSVVVDPEVAKQMFGNIMSGKSWSGELEMKTKSGRIFPAFEFADSIKDSEGNIIGLIGIITDMSERKQAEKDILEMNKELSKYLQVISHDLRSPLVGVQGYAMRYGKQTETLKTILTNCQLDAASKELIDKITFEDMPKSLNAILASVDKMDTLLKGLSRISNTGRAILIIKKINMNQLFKAIVSTHSFHLEENGALINIADLPDCYGDENQLNQLFSNIMGNALKYHDPLRPLIIEVTSKTHHHKVIYSIKDNGIGIPPAKLEKIWDVFFRVNPNTAVTGEGIGLSFVKRIADKHKGRIWAESTEGVGSTFHVELQQNEFTE